MIKVKNICFSHNKAPLLNNVSFNIDQGECVGLTGPSGCGKSTLARIVAGYFHPKSGEIIVNGKNCTGEPGRNVFLINQENDLFPWQNVYNQIAFALKDDDPRFVGELIHVVKLDGYEKYFPRQLSGGMKKKLSIARALAVKSKLIILDESFSFLDLKLKMNLYQELKCIWEKTETTIMVITHDERDLENLTQREIKLGN